MFMVAAVVSLYILGLLWCCEVIRRFPSDVREIFELREKGRTVVIVFIWIITVPLTLGVVTYSFVLVKRLIWFFGTF